MIFNRETTSVFNNIQFVSFPEFSVNMFEYTQCNYILYNKKQCIENFQD